MIAVDTSVAAKWFKPGERYEAEALDLGARIARGEVGAIANEIVSLELVRALLRAQHDRPSLGITPAHVQNAYLRMEALLDVGNMLRCSVGEVRALAKDIQVDLGLFMADALHLATALYLRVTHFVADDRHLLNDDVVAYARRFGVEVVNLPDLISALGTPVSPAP